LTEGYSRLLLTSRNRSALDSNRSTLIFDLLL